MKTGPTLVVYYSLSGNTARVARDLAKLVGADVESLRDTEHGVGFFGYLKAALHAVTGAPAKLGPLSRNPQDYGLTIVGTPIWAGHMTPAIRAWLDRYRAHLGRVAYFTTCGGSDPGKVVRAMERLVGRTGVAFVGFDAKELADAERYAAKLREFVDSLDRPASPPVAAAAGGAH
jgi:flavodoxin